MSNDPSLEEKKKYVNTMMTSKDAEALRLMLFESLSVIGKLYKKVQMHMLLHPLFFLGGFVLGFYFGGLNGS
jgi:hypothetical protein